MARKVKVLLDENGVDKRESGYYSTPDFIAKYLTYEMLKINPNGESVLDPAVGKEELLHYFKKEGKKIDSFDVIDFEKLGISNFRHQDFIEYYIDKLQNNPFAPIQEPYDYIIANPPYNCHELAYIRDNKKKLNVAFPVGAYNMYSIFLSAMISIAKEGCLIGVIISDSFLTATLHSKLREQIYSECSIHQIILCPNDLFWNQKADVRTCLMILQKGRKYQKEVVVQGRPENTSSFIDILINHQFKNLPLHDIKLGNDKLSNQVVIDIPDKIISIIKSNPSLGSLYKCATCISTGNDAKYLSTYKKDGFTVPFYKNPAKRKFKTEPDAYLISDYMEESMNVKDFMVRNKSFLLNEGIVCSSMGLPFSVAYKPSGAVSGVNATIFPKHEDVFWLMGYLNSSFITYIVRGVLIRSNMITSGYVSRIPIIKLSDDDKRHLGEISIKAYKGDISVSEAISLCDGIVYKATNLDDTIIEEIEHFVSNLGKTV